MFLDCTTRLFNLSRFSTFDVGPRSKAGLYPVRAFYPDSDRYEILYAQVNIDHCYEYLHKLAHLTNAKAVDMHTICECED